VIRLPRASTPVGSSIPTIRVPVAARLGRISEPPARVLPRRLGAKRGAPQASLPHYSGYGYKPSSACSRVQSIWSHVLP